MNSGSPIAPPTASPSFTTPVWRINTLRTGKTVMRITSWRRLALSPSGNMIQNSITYSPRPKNRAIRTTDSNPRTISWAPLSGPPHSTTSPRNTSRTAGWAVISTCCTKALKEWASPTTRAMPTGTTTVTMGNWCIMTSAQTTTPVATTTMTASSGVTARSLRPAGWASPAT